MGDAGWLVVVPAKGLGAAKSRLRGAVPAAAHGDLALAMLRDTLAAATACADVLVVAGDAAVAAVARAAGAAVLPDPGAGLNAAIRLATDPPAAGPQAAGHDLAAGARAAHGLAAGRAPGGALGRPRAALTGDLPGLRAEELAAALRAAEAAGGRAFVADAAGTGTVLLAAPAGVPLDPAFGVGSAAAHAAGGARALTGDWPGLRHDADTAADLRAALRHGPAAHTRALLGDLPSSDAAACAAR
ncbi:2-phospho-L-lactate guanylyltransferase [Spirilliplanes yamanashiensis]|uniref:Phosphoenolpyruvate guanylyltransferase n=1 Tax=Spirilliplanes yamanashiensis TaxID=42233 RepID=A0A8J3Y4J2_9ACTN|nr:2-phospho-L-lactate guanylyltransferase [Spirilliplanes yamanashiensis]MDP9819765.1 2-phospho-L-lactate guanylyltransferase [Spirilliplanes yamanashiensis]GIJ01415.1 2-phospho-L-lactate guanylyltransferase [Spirilliplanes yamanashiensis]